MIVGELYKLILIDFVMPGCIADGAQRRRNEI